MPTNFSRNVSNFGGFTPSNKITDQITELNKLERVIELEPDISDEIERIFRERGKILPDIFKPKLPDLRFPLPGKPPISSNPTQTPNEPPVLEVDTRLQLLLSAIPLAHPGNIITSEYHNALRDAVRALASRIGLSVNPTAEFKILSFAPNFLPVPNVPGSSPTVGTVAPNKWDVALNRAAVPIANLNIQVPVSGGVVVQLPDNASIMQMIIRGERLDKDKPNPKSFNVRLNRQKFGKEKTPPTTLINLDLAAVKDGYFEEKQTVKLNSNELDTDTVTAQAKIADRRTVNNETHLYYVRADWEAGAETAAKSEIHSIQIYCTI